jgi:hypothetical protein
MGGGAGMTREMAKREHAFLSCVRPLFSDVGLRDVVDFFWRCQVLVKEVKSNRASLDKSRKVNKKLLTAYDALEKKHRALKAAVQQSQQGGGRPDARL